MPHDTILIGLMSGTSTDGIDAASVRIADASVRIADASVRIADASVRIADASVRIADASVRVGESSPPPIELLGFSTVAYDEPMRRELLRCSEGGMRVPELARLNSALGELLAQAASAVMAQAGLQATDVLAVGSHGHTVAHLPPRAESAGAAATLQIGEAAVIAERLGVPVVCDFRVRDVAAGGQGAPLVPHFDHTFLHSATVNRAVLNIGGIANVTVLPAGAGEEELRAFDIGPGNMPLDAAVALLVPGSPGYDEDGKLAAAGKPDEGLVAWVLSHPFLSQPVPRSCGREEFGEPFVRQALRQSAGLSAADILASLTVACGRAIGETIAGLQGTDGCPWEIIASGGGVHNLTLMATIAETTRMPLRRSDDFGIPSDAKEAMAFAFLALECLQGRPGNVPAATGAAGPRVLGKIVPG